MPTHLDPLFIMVYLLVLFYLRKGHITTALHLHLQPSITPCLPRDKIWNRVWSSDYFLTQTTLPLGFSLVPSPERSTQTSIFRTVRTSQSIYRWVSFQYHSVSIQHHSVSIQHHSVSFQYTQSESNTTQSHSSITQSESSTTQSHSSTTQSHSKTCVQDINVFHWYFLQNGISDIFNGFTLDLEVSTQQLNVPAQDGNQMPVDFSNFPEVSTSGAQTLQVSFRWQST